MKKIVSIIILIIQLPIMFLLLMAFLAPFIPPDRVVFPAFAGLAFPWIYLTNLILIVILLLLKPKYAIPGILFFLIGFYDILQHVRFSGNEAKPENGVKFLTYNCQGLHSNYEYARGKALSDSVARFISHEAFDIVCLQEFRGVQDEETAAFMTQFCEKIGLHNFHYQRYFADRSHNATLCLATFSKYPIIARNAIQLGKRRIGMHTDIVMGKDTVRVFNIHLQSTRIVREDIDFMMGTPELQQHTKYWNIYKKLAQSYKLRTQQARLVALEINKSPYPVVVCGDFNDTPTSFAYHRIAKDLEDAFIRSGKGMGNTYNSDALPPIRIDYILYDNSYKSAKFSIYELPFSDHFPVSTLLHK